MLRPWESPFMETRCGVPLCRVLRAVEPGELFVRLHSETRSPCSGRQPLGALACRGEAALPRELRARVLPLLTCALSQQDGLAKELSVAMQLLRNCLYQNKDCRVSRAPGHCHFCEVTQEGQWNTRWHLSGA